MKSDGSSNNKFDKASSVISIIGGVFFLITAVTEFISKDYLFAATYLVIAVSWLLSAIQRDKFTFINGIIGAVAFTIMGIVRLIAADYTFAAFCFVVVILAVVVIIKYRPRK